MVLALGFVLFPGVLCQTDRYLRNLIFWFSTFFTGPFDYMTILVAGTKIHFAVQPLKIGS